MQMKRKLSGVAAFAGIVVGLLLVAQECAAVQVDAVKGTVLKFHEGTDTIVYIPSNATVHVTGAGTLDMLVVGGGGGGGVAGGGGGGGAVVYTQNLEVVEKDYDITVGMGGVGGYRDTVAAKWVGATNGGESEAFGITAPGGGAGGSYGVNAQKGGDGASGGGGGIGYFVKSQPRKFAGGFGMDGYGFAGGASTNDAGSVASLMAGGGGGAGGPGEDGRYETVTYHRSEPKTGTCVFGGSGGDGKLCTIWGSRYYGGGGGGGRGNGTCYPEVRTGRGGRGGGGYGGYRDTSTTTSGEDGWANTGGGGGGSGAPRKADDFAIDCPPGSKGGSGVVILRYPTPEAEKLIYLEPEAVVTGGEVTHPKRRDVVHTFKEDGTLVLPQALSVDLLMVGGGGGGGGFHGGGGGGGDVLVFSNLVLAAGTYSIAVGAGGTAGSAAGGCGETTTFSTESGALLLSAFGGGGGGSISMGLEGANGGGGSAGEVYSSLPERGKNSYRAGGYTLWGGFDGGSATNGTAQTEQNGGGGGGAGGAGVSSVAVSKGYAAGGVGLACDFSGSVCYYGGGGGGGGTAPSGVYVGGLGGEGGGGNGGAYGEVTPDGQPKHPTVGTPGTPNTGGGGGGGGAAIQTGAAGGEGGSGIVIVRCHYAPTGLIILLK